MTKAELADALEKLFAQYVSIRCGSHNVKRINTLRENDFVLDNAIVNALRCAFAFQLDQSNAKARQAEANAIDAVNAALADVGFDDDTNYRVRSAITLATRELAAKR